MPDDPSLTTDEDEIVVRAIIPGDGRNFSQFSSVAFAPDTLGVGQYNESDSGSDSDSESSEEAKLPQLTKEEPNGLLPAAQPNGQPSTKRKRVRFADDVKIINEKPAKLPRLSSDDKADGGGERDGDVEDAEDDELAADMARFQSMLGLSRNSEEADLDLAEAEDAREEALQLELQARVERMREKLHGYRGKEAGKVSPDNEVLKENVNVQRQDEPKSEKEDAQPRGGEQAQSSEAASIEDRDSDDDVDLMRDWTQPPLPQ